MKTMSNDPENHEQDGTLEDTTHAYECISFHSPTLSHDLYITQTPNLSYSSFLWPSAQILCDYIWYQRHLFQDRAVMELGCGRALPSLLCAKLGAHVICTDIVSNLSSYLNDTITKNALDTSRIEFMPLKWGQFDGAVLAGTKVDICIGADIFYDTKGTLRITSIIFTFF